MSGGTKRSREDSSSVSGEVLVIHSGRAFVAPSVYKVDLPNSPFAEASHLSEPKVYYLPMTGDDTAEVDDDDESVRSSSSDFVNDEGVRNWTVSSMCKDLGIGMSKVNEWLWDGHFMSGVRVFHPLCLGPFGRRMLC